ncbi:MAG: nucleotide-binding protein [Methanomicrobiales archaeon]|nr:nucleotide-binding protein [Methanomicrobiales archaeon]
MILVLDASAFFTGMHWSGTLATTHSVVEEIADLRAKGHLEVFLAGGLMVREPSPESTKTVKEAAAATGDLQVLSGTDIDLLALAIDISGLLVSDDFAVHNVAIRLGLPTQTIQQRRPRARVWRYRCQGCRKVSSDPGDCPVCGAQVRRSLIK